MTRTNIPPFVMTSPINAQDSSPLDKTFTVEEGLEFMSNYHGEKVTYLNSNCYQAKGTNRPFTTATTKFVCKLFSECRFEAVFHRQNIGPRRQQRNFIGPISLYRIIPHDAWCNYVSACCFIFPLPSYHHTTILPYYHVLTPFSCVFNNQKNTQGNLLMLAKICDEARDKEAQHEALHHDDEAMHDEAMHNDEYDEAMHDEALYDYDEDDDDDINNDVNSINNDVNSTQLRSQSMGDHDINDDNNDGDCDGDGRNDDDDRKRRTKQTRSMGMKTRLMGMKTRLNGDEDHDDDRVKSKTTTTLDCNNDDHDHDHDDHVDRKKRDRKRRTKQTRSMGMKTRLMGMKTRLNGDEDHDDRVKKTTTTMLATRRSPRKAAASAAASSAALAAISSTKSPFPIMLKWKEGSRPAKAKSRRQTKRKAPPMKNGTMLLYAKKQTAAERRILSKKAQHCLNARTKGWLQMIRLAASESRSRKKAHPQYPRALSLMSNAGVYTIVDHLWSGDQFQYTLVLKTERYTTRILESDLDDIIDRGELVPDEDQLKSLTTKSTWSLDWFTLPSAEQNGKSLWPSYHNVPNWELAEYKEKFNRRFTAKLRRRNAGMLRDLENIMLSYGAPPRILWTEWMDGSISFDVFVFQSLVCITLSAGTGDVSLQPFIDRLFKKFISPADFVSEEGQRAAWIFMTKSAALGGRSILYCNKKAGYIIAIAKRLILGAKFGIDSQVHLDYVEQTWIRKVQKGVIPFLGKPVPTEWLPKSGETIFPKRTLSKRWIDYVMNFAGVGAKSMAMFAYSAFGMQLWVAVDRHVRRLVVAFALGMAALNEDALRIQLMSAFEKVDYNRVNEVAAGLGQHLNRLPMGARKSLVEDLRKYASNNNLSEEMECFLSVYRR
jgi:endonuclease III